MTEDKNITLQALQYIV